MVMAPTFSPGTPYVPWLFMKSPGASTDVTAAVRTAISNAIAQTGKLYFHAGTYKISLGGGSQISTVTGILEWSGAGMDNTILSIDDVAITNGVAINFGASFVQVQHSATNITITTQIAPTDANNGNTLVLTPAGSGTEFTAGDWIQLRDPNEDTNTDQNGRFIVQIRSISSDTLTLEDSTPLIFPVGTQVWRRVNDNHSLYIHDMTILCNGTAPPTNSNQLLSVYGYRNVVIERVHFNNTSQAALWLDSCQNWTIRDCVFDDCDGGSAAGAASILRSTSGTAVTNKVQRCRFGIGCQASPRSKILNNDFNSGYRADTGGGNAYLGGRAWKLTNGSAESEVSGNISRLFGSPCVIFDSPRSRIHHNQIQGTGIAAGAFLGSGHGIWCGSNLTGTPATGSDRCEIYDNILEECGGYALFIGDTTCITADQFIQAHGNLARNCAQGFVYMGAKNCKIYDNHDESCGLSNADLTKAGIYEAANATKNRYENNRFTSINGVTPINTTAGTAPAYIGPHDYSDCNTQPTWKTTDYRTGGPDTNLRQDLGDIAGSSTLNTQGYSHLTVALTSGKTGFILQPGADGQQIVIANDSVSGADTFAWAASGTSNVGNAANAGLAQGQQRLYIYDRKVAFWYATV